MAFFHIRTLSTNGLVIIIIIKCTVDVVTVLQGHLTMKQMPQILTSEPADMLIYVDRQVLYAEYVEYQCCLLTVYLFCVAVPSSGRMTETGNGYSRTEGVTPLFVTSSIAAATSYFCGCCLR